MSKPATSEPERIAEQVSRAFEGEAWHGPSLSELLEGVTAAQAASRPAAGFHSIWELVLHIGAWERVVLRRLNGEAIPNLPPEKDWPPAGHGDAAWKDTLATLARGNRELRAVIARFDSARLNDPVPGKDYPFFVMLFGIAEHTLYHAGQIALLKKGRGTRG